MEDRATRSPTPAAMALAHAGGFADWPFPGLALPSLALPLPSLASQGLLDPAWSDCMFPCHFEQVVLRLMLPVCRISKYVCIHVGM